jgi:flagellar hook-length control protein FliK
MSLELTPSPVPIQSTATAKSTTAPTSGKDGAVANPFASLLAGLNAAQQSQSSDMNETPVQNSANADAETITTTTSSLSDPIDALKIFMGPAFNSRLALAQTEDIGKSAPIPQLATAATPVPADAATSLLALLAAKTQAPNMLEAANVAALAVEDKIASDALTDTTEALALAESAPALTSIDVDAELADEPVTNETPEAAEGTDLTTVVAASVVTPQIIPIELKPALPVATNTIASDTEADGNTKLAKEISGSDMRISLFDKLNQSPADRADTKTDLATDMSPAEPAEIVIAIPASAPDTVKPELNAANITLAAAQQPITPTQNPLMANNLPQVTMRPLNEAQLVEGVSVLMTRAAKNQVNEFIIRMDPPELGRIDVQMKMHEDGTVQAVIASDNPNTHDLLRREASTIERALADAGFRTGNDGLSFNLKHQNGEHQRRDFGANGSSYFNGAQESDDAIPDSVLAPLRQRYENARVNITA